jgi:hypothetical protein
MGRLHLRGNRRFCMFASCTECTGCCISHVLRCKLHSQPRRCVLDATCPFNMMPPCPFGLSKTSFCPFGGIPVHLCGAALPSAFLSATLSSAQPRCSALPKLNSTHAVPRRAMPTTCAAAHARNGVVCCFVCSRSCARRTVRTMRWTRSRPHTPSRSISTAHGETAVATILTIILLLALRCNILWTKVVCRWFIRWLSTWYSRGVRVGLLRYYRKWDCLLRD